MSDATAEWGNRRAPTLAELDAMAERAYERLPEAVRKQCGDVIVRVEELPADEVLDDLDIESPFDLLGLYRGSGLAARDTATIPHGPDMVFLYRRPILDYWAEFDEPLGHIITHVLVHEIGHHFGLSDADMERIEAEAKDGGLR